MSEQVQFGIRPLSPELWPDIETLFGPHGACAGCWCMVPRKVGAQARLKNNESNHRAFRDLVTSGSAHGLLAYAGDRPAGWCAIGPREEFPALERSRIMRRIDDEPVWSITCFYIPREHRRKGLMSRLVDAAIHYAADHGARIVEAYPVEPRMSERIPFTAYTGVASSLRRAGFTEVARRSETRPVMRYWIEG